MSTSPHASGHPPTSDWVEDVAVAVALLTAVVIIAGILALVIIV